MADSKQSNETESIVGFVNLPKILPFVTTHLMDSVPSPTMFGSRLARSEHFAQWLGLSLMSKNRKTGQL